MKYFTIENECLRFYNLVENQLKLKCVRNSISIYIFIFVIFLISKFWKNKLKMKLCLLDSIKFAIQL